ncbi:MAG: hypothetical protein ACKVJC_10060 [Flavobacteriales bacterium]
MNKIINYSIVLLLAGCATPQSKYVSSNGASNLNTNVLNNNDMAIAAEYTINSLLESGVLKKQGNEVPILGISRIINNTSYHIDTDLLVKRIRVTLNKSGKALTTSTLTMGNRNTAEDPLAKALNDKNDFLDDNKPIDPDFTLSGKIIQNNINVGNKKEVTYTFQLSLTDVRRGSRTAGLAIWEDFEEITKQTKRRSVGL